jgi:hypothetical protein
MMFACGMGKESGEFSFNVGVPALGTRSENRPSVVMMVVPDVMGICYYDRCLERRKERRKSAALKHAKMNMPMRAGSKGSVADGADEGEDEGSDRFSMESLGVLGASHSGQHFCRQFAEIFRFHLFSGQDVVVADAFLDAMVDADPGLAEAFGLTPRSSMNMQRYTPTPRQSSDCCGTPRKSVVNEQASDPMPRRSVTQEQFAPLQKSASLQRRSSVSVAASKGRQSWAKVQSGVREGEFTAIQLKATLNQLVDSQRTSTLEDSPTPSRAPRASWRERKPSVTSFPRMSPHAPSRRLKPVNDDQDEADDVMMALASATHEFNCENSDDGSAAATGRKRSESQSTDEGSVPLADQAIAINLAKDLEEAMLGTARATGKMANMLQSVAAGKLDAGKLDNELINLHFSYDPCAFWEGGPQMCSMVLEAAQAGDLGLIKQLHATGVSVASVADYDLRTASHLACVEGNIEIVKYLNQHGADFHFKDRWGRTAIDDANNAGHKDVIYYLQHGVTAMPLVAGQQLASRVPGVPSLELGLMPRC